MKSITDYNLQSHNTFGIEARCRRYVEFRSEDELCDILPELVGTPLLILGGGSNLLLTRDYEGTVLHSSIVGFSVTQVGNQVFMRCGSGELWDDIVALSVENGWYGAENLSLIPGEVGATAVQNIGAYGVEASSIIHKVEAIDLQTGQKVTFSNADCCYGYRTSRFKHQWHNRYFITHVTYRLSRIFTPRLHYGNLQAVITAAGEGITPLSLRRQVIALRRQKLPDPAIEGNAGSFFMNPIVDAAQFAQLQAAYPDVPNYPLDDGRVKVPAGWLIEQCGWKGRTLGRAGVHSRQALVLVNRGGATGEDILQLCNAIVDDVARHFHITLQPEVNII